MSQKLTLQIPSKTFFAGEYLALTGGASFVLSTKKYFEFEVSQGPSSQWVPHPESPAGQVISKNSDFFKNLDIQFSNPYSSGGFGASTAEFIAVQALLQLGGSLWIEQERFFDLQQFLKAYREVSKSTGHWSPSGADLVGQIQGGVSFFERNSGKLQKFGWPFYRLGFLLLKTGVKVPTHEHLQRLTELKTESMSLSLEQIHSAFRNIDEQQLISGLTDFQEELLAQKLVCPETLAKLQKLHHPAIRLKKGCGALGADVILLVYDLEQKQALVDFISNTVSVHGCELIASEADLASGLSVKVNA